MGISDLKLRNLYNLYTIFTQFPPCKIGVRVYAVVGRGSKPKPNLGGSKMVSWSKMNRTHSSRVRLDAACYAENDEGTEFPSWRELAERDAEEAEFLILAEDWMEEAERAIVEGVLID